MKKLLLWLTVIMLCISIVAMFSLAGCKEEVVEEEAPAEEAVEEETPAEEAVEEVIKLKVFLLSEDENRLRLYNEYYEPKVKEAFPNYEVEFELPGVAYEDKFVVYNSSGELPDIFWGQTDLAIQTGNALDYTPYIYQDGFAERFKNPGALIPYSDGKIYAISSGTDAYFSAGVYYNKGIFEKEGINVPTNYSELVDVCTTLAAKGYIPLSVVIWAVENWMFQEFLVSENPDYIQNLIDNKAKFTDEPYVEAAAKIQELVDIGTFPKDVAVISHEGHVELFNSEKAAMIYHPLWVLPGVSPDIDIDYFSLVTYGKDPKILNAWGTAWNGFMVAKNSENPDAAVKLAEWLCEQDAEYFTLEVGNATSLDVGLPAPEMSEIVKSYYNALNNPESTVIQNFTFNYLGSAGLAELETNMEKLITNQIDAEQFGAAMDEVYSK